MLGRLSRGQVQQHESEREHASEDGQPGEETANEHGEHGRNLPE